MIKKLLKLFKDKTPNQDEWIEKLEYVEAPIHNIIAGDLIVLKSRVRCRDGFWDDVKKQITDGLKIQGLDRYVSIIILEDDVQIEIIRTDTRAWGKLKIQ